MGFFWVISVIGSVLGGLNILFTMAAATSAPQQAGGYALSCALAIVPYVLARSMQAMAKSRTDIAADRIIAAIEKPKTAP